VSNVEIRTVELTENMVRAIAKQAEAERDRRAKIIHAEAEFQASQTLVNAAQILSSIPAAMQLRYLQTLTEMIVSRRWWKLELAIISCREVMCSGGEVKRLLGSSNVKARPSVDFA